MIGLARAVSAIGNFYVTLIVIYVLLSWLPMRGFVYDVHRVLASVVEPYLGLFRRIIPPVGMIDISPIVAILVLQVLLGVVVRAVAGL